ncbi:ABC transporter permease [Paenibacillus sp. CAA11]|nr:ABC transporter permease [Paenibacillus sp. CAA11]
MIYIYALSLLFYFSNCMRRNPGAKRVGAGLLACVLLLQLAGFCLRFWKDGVEALFSPYDYLLLVSFSLGGAALVMTFFQKSELAAALVNVIGLLIMMVNRLSFSDQDYPLIHGYTVHGLLVLHVALAGISFAALSLAAVFAGLYLYLHRRLKVKKWSDTIRRLPSLETLDHYIPLSMMWGTSLLSVSLLIAGAVIATEGSWETLADLKVGITIAALGVYLLYFLGRHYKRYTGVRMAQWALVGYAVLIINFLMNSWSAFHSWNWR